MLCDIINIDIISNTRIDTNGIYCDITSSMMPNYYSYNCVTIILYYNITQLFPGSPAGLHDWIYMKSEGRAGRWISLCLFRSTKYK